MSTWMVVEDEPTLYETLLALFEIWSIDGVAFTNGSDAIRWIEDVDAGKIETNVPELAMIDIRLVGGPFGDKVAQRLRQSPILGNIVIVFMTVYRLTPQEEQEILESGKTKYLIYKPLPSPPELQTFLRRAISGGSAK